MNSTAKITTQTTFDESFYADLTETPSDITNHDASMHRDLSVGEIFAMIAQILLIALNITGNTLVIMIFLKTRSIREKIFNWYIFNLAIADFLVTIDMLTNLLKWYYGRWPLGGNVCTVFMVLIYTAIYMSAVMITMMSFDRYLRICRPIQYRFHQTSSKSRLALKLILVGIWVGVFTFYAIFGFGWTAMTGERPLDYTTLCEMQYVENAVMNFVSLALEFFIPILLLSFFNILVYIKINEQINLFQKTQPTNSPREDSFDENQSLASEDMSAVDIKGNGDSCNSTPRGTPKFQRKMKLQHMPISQEIVKKNFSKRRAKELTRLRRSAIFLAMYVVVFILCWLPYYIMILANTFCSTCHTTVTTYIIMVYILDVNSVLNPILYSISNRPFRRHVKEFLRQIFCCKGLRGDTRERGYSRTGGSQRSTYTTAD